MDSKQELNELEVRLLDLEFEALKRQNKKAKPLIEARAVLAKFPNVLQRKIVNGKTVFIFNVPGKGAHTLPSDAKRWHPGLRAIKDLKGL